VAKPESPLNSLGRRSILNSGSKDIVVLSQLVAGDHEFAGASKDPDDDKYIAAAIEGRAQFVVAGD
jgi:predicted nucleic acid-binding protein